MSVTIVPASKAAEHVVPQSIPPGLDVITPAPLPVRRVVNRGRSATVSVYLQSVR